MLRLTRAFLLASPLLVAGCSTPSPGASCAAYVVPVATDLTKPTVSFKSDVMPIFTQSCAFTSCHGMPGGTNQGIFLGQKPPVVNDPSMIRMGLVGKKSGELASMDFVAPGDPAQSYVMHKIDGDNCVFDKMCTSGSCQATMPQAGDLLPVESRDTVRRWIAQGALDN